MGIKGKRNRTSKSIIEPPILDDVDSVIAEAKRKGLVNKTPIDIEEIVKDAGIVLIMEELPSSVSGYLKNENGKWIIGVNRLHNIRRRRFTIAHEFGHYILHRDESNSFEDISFFRKENDSSIEYKANEFAAKLLMPEDLIREAIDSGKTLLEELAEVFNVSVLALTFRIKELGYNINNGE